LTAWKSRAAATERTCRFASGESRLAALVGAILKARRLIDGDLPNPIPSRRLAAILAADIAGYSALMGADEARTVSDLKGHQAVVLPIVAEHGGRIIDTAGDGILAEFGSVVNAVECGRCIQWTIEQRNVEAEKSSRMLYRIGINLGDIIHDKSRVYGDGVNIAARLESIAEPGGICISGTVHEHVRGKLAYPFTNRGEQTLKNIAQPVRVYSLEPETIAALPKALAPPATHRKAWRWYVPVLVVGFCCTVVLSIYLGLSGQTSTVLSHFPGTRLTSVVERKALTDAPPQSIVVLPFTNAARDPAQEYFAEGITEDLTTDLSRIPGSFVIAPATAFTYKGKAIDVRQVGRDLSVRYALQGNARRIDDTVRINAQLVDTSNASQLWAERFDGGVAQLAIVQDQVTRRIAAALKVVFIDAESHRVLRERPSEPDAVDFTMRGSALLNKPASRESTQHARELFEAALGISPNHLPALNGLAQTMLVQWESTWYPQSGDEHLEELDHVVNRAIAVKADNALAIYLHGYVLKRLRKDLSQALAAFEHAIGIDPNLAVAHNYIGQLQVFLGRSNEAAQHTLKAIRLSPHDPQLALWYYQLAVTYIHDQRDHEAVEWARRGVQVNPNVRYVYRILAAALALSGRLDEARAVAAEMLRRYPKETVSSFLKREPWPDARYRVGQNREITGMRMAGIPE
jgi:adenylate cyclase